MGKCGECWFYPAYGNPDEKICSTMTLPDGEYVKPEDECHCMAFWRDFWVVLDLLGTITQVEQLIADDLTFCAKGLLDNSLCVYGRRGTMSERGA